MKRVRQDGVRSVHAYTRETDTTLSTADVRANPACFRVRYNPHVHYGFFAADTGGEVTTLALLAPDGETACGIQA